MPVHSNITSGVLHRRLAGRSPVRFGVVVLVFLIVLGVGARGRFYKMSAPEGHKTVEDSRAQSAAAALEPSVRAQAAQTRIEVERLNLRQSGFQPDAITRPPGRFLLVVNNITGEDEDWTLKLDREAGGALPRAKLPRDKRRWRDLVDLPPGRYLLTEANHPEWVCRITIAAQ
jgi:hypothetical protein